MRELLLKMYFYLRQLPKNHGLSAAIAVSMALLEKDDFLALHSTLLRGDPQPEALSPDLLSEEADIATAVGAAIAQMVKGQGGVVVAPVFEEDVLNDPSQQALLAWCLEQQLPMILLTQRPTKDGEELLDQENDHSWETIQADAQDIMKLMPALRLAIDKAREGDGPTLIECVQSQADEPAPSAEKRLSDILITEGYATPEELL